MKRELSNADKKAKEIQETIERMFDGRLGGVVICYLFDKGAEKVSQITDEEISEIQGEEFISAKFCQALVRTAREIARNYSFTDLLPFINKIPYRKY